MKIKDTVLSMLQHLPLGAKRQFLFLISPLLPLQRVVLMLIPLLTLIYVSTTFTLITSVNAVCCYGSAAVHDSSH